VERFVATLIEVDGGGAFVEVPPEVVAALGGGGRIKVRARFNGIDYRGSVVTMGDLKVLGVLKAIRKQLAKAPGDELTVELERDDEERRVEVPGDLAAGLWQAGEREAFDRLSFSHRREYVAWIDEAKKSETRARRIAQTVQRIRDA
jgi:hypothetical protein